MFYNSCSTEKLCSYLNYDLCNNRLRPDPTCNCLRDEGTAEHYVLNVIAMQIKELSYSYLVIPSFIEISPSSTPQNKI